MSVVSELDKSDYDVIEVHGGGHIVSDGSYFTSYRIRQRFWALIEDLRDQRVEFPCGDGAGVHHVDEPVDDDRRYTCGNEYCDARYTRADVESTLSEVTTLVE